MVVGILGKVMPLSPRRCHTGFLGSGPRGVLLLSAPQVLMNTDLKAEDA